MTDRVFVLGAGRAGRGLARALRASGVALVGVHGRRALADDALHISAGALPATLAGATVVLLAVRDEQLKAALRDVLAARPAAGTVVLQCSGSAEPAGLDAARAAGCPAGTFHPLVPLADPTLAPALLHGAWIGIDGDPAAVATATRLAAALGAYTLTIPAGQRARYHAAAVFASNFPIALAAMATRLLTTAGVDGASAAAAVGGLMAAAAANLRNEPATKALTGPVARGDAVTIQRHLAALTDLPAARAVYLQLSREALRLARERGGDPPADRLTAIERLLDGA